MTDYELTMTAVVIHSRGTNPLFGEGILRIRLDDEAGGPFLVLEQEIDGEENEIRLDFEEIPLIVRAANLLQQQKGLQDETQDSP